MSEIFTSLSPIYIRQLTPYSQIEYQITEAGSWTDMPNAPYIKNTNVFYNATTLTDHTTWSTPIIHPKYNVICKYPKQCDEAYASLYLWNNGYRWKYENNSLLLKK